jgi:hypothetical protein
MRDIRPQASSGSKVHDLERDKANLRAANVTEE